MMDCANLLIRALDGSHERAGFHCGIASLDDYLQKQARQDVKRRVSRVYAATAPDHPDKVVGYYTLSTLSIELDHLPESIARKLPRRPVPAVLLGRLAVDKIAQGHGVGKMLLVDALKRTLAVSDEIAIYAMVVDAINEQAQGFYAQFDFSPLGAEGRRLFLPLQSV